MEVKRSNDIKEPHFYTLLLKKRESERIRYETI